MSEPKVSIIIPVFKAENYIEECMASVQAQTLQDIEILFIDDCGGDSSISVIERYAKEDERIRILYNAKNSGSGFSRNRGIEEARGTYLAFLDPDDYLSPDFLELLYTCATKNNADIAKGTRSLIHEHEGTRFYEDQDALNAHIEEGLRHGISLFALFTYQHTTAIYRRELVLSHGARYGSSKNGQDTTFLLKICHAARSIYIEPRARYYYIQHEGSSVHTFSDARLTGEIVSLKEKLDYLIDQSLTGGDGVRYLCTRIGNTLSVHSYMLSNGQDAQASSFLAEITVQARRVPNAEELCEQSLWMRALIEDGANISPPGSVAGVANDEREASVSWLQRCVTFVLENPSERARYLDEVKRAVARSLSEQKSMAPAEEKDLALAEVRGVLSALPGECLEELCKRTPWIRALVEYGANLRPMQAPQEEDEVGTAKRMLECATHWVDFVLVDLPRRKELLDGIFDSIYVFLSRQAIIRNSAEGQRMLEDACVSLRKLPQDLQSTLCKKSLWMRALVEHGANLRPMQAPQDEDEVGTAKRMLECANRWVLFVAEDPSRRVGYLRGVKVFLSNALGAKQEPEKEADYYALIQSAYRLIEQVPTCAERDEVADLLATCKIPRKDNANKGRRSVLMAKLKGLLPRKT